MFLLSLYSMSPDQKFSQKATELIILHSEIEFHPLHSPSS
ncbi:hypothetical protein M595_2003 [Lyngbya aestuarii BL J]|uniref:Uncharacterized protein n=1 Tax=Lyngbya aestuarii BL J TaxID=1348334 RepID=U7QL41_9CYAN|nr:hypothetical protein M595_2003 [Lyngbya aestuarii BL J]